MLTVISSTAAAIADADSLCCLERMATSSEACSSSSEADARRSAPATISFDHRTQRLLHCLHARKQAGRVAWCAPDIGGQVAGGNLLGDLGGVLRVTAQRVHDVAADDKERERDEAADSDTPDQEFCCLLAEEGVHIIDVDAGTDDPAPGFEALDVRDFRNRCIRTRLRPEVIDVAGTRGLDDLDELYEQDLAGRILHLIHRLAPSSSGRTGCISVVGEKSLIQKYSVLS